jgi:subfamily B ATP-binding cassette protein MsbA
VVNLLPRFYDVTDGCITIDGVDIRNASLKSLRRQIGVVTQETFLFNKTAFNNIHYGSDDKDEAEVIAAAQAAFAHDFIMNLPGGYDSIIGERGVRLSGGERQRVAIARALLRDPPILILDEATSALDTCAEREVQKALDLLMQNRTVIAIAHRLSTVRHADKIVVIKEGRVIEQGTHAELMARGGEYKRLYEMQFFLGEYSLDHYGEECAEPEAGARR